MGRKLLKTVQTITTFRNPLVEPVTDPLWSADPSLKTAVTDDTCSDVAQKETISKPNNKCKIYNVFVINTTYMSAGMKHAVLMDKM